MIKNYFLLVLLFIVSFIAKAQPVLNATDFETELSMTLYNASVSGLLPGDAGANQTWDFSGLTLTPGDLTISTVAVATAISANSFPTSTYCWKVIDSRDPNNISTGYAFFNLSNKLTLDVNTQPSQSTFASKPCSIFLSRYSKISFAWHN